MKYKKAIYYYDFKHPVDRVVNFTLWFVKPFNERRPFGYITRGTNFYIEIGSTTPTGVFVED